MRNALSTAVIALALALLVPSNGAQAVRLGDEGMRIVSAALALHAPAERPATAGVLSPRESPDPGVAWILALGFLGAVVVRRMRG